MRYKNNPANIRYSVSNHWLGQSDPDNGFCTFKDLDYGVRALMILLKRYINNYHLRSVGSIIKRFAPVSENPTSAYIRFVRDFICNHSGNPNDIKPFTFEFYLLIQAICYFESKTGVTVDFLSQVSSKFHFLPKVEIDSSLSKPI